MKHRRREAILEIINETPVTTQNQLIRLLAERGIVTTQATLSRDVQRLSLVKSFDANGINRYVQSKNTENERSLFEQAVLSVDYAMNTIVLKCRSGMAQGTCAAIDAVEHEGVVGTIAGDDTIFILVRSEADAKRLSKIFSMKLLGGHTN